MVDFLESKLGKYIFYVLLHICAFIINWVLIGWISYDFNFMKTQTRAQLLIQITTSLLWFVLLFNAWHLVLDK